MRSVLRVFLFSACLPLLPAQTSAPDGVAPEWDIRVILQEVADHADRLVPVLDRIDVKSWGGASETYAAQLQSCKDQAKALANGARALARKPDKLSTALELYFRMHGIDNMMQSLEEGIRRYQNPAVAEMLAGVAAENSINRERFQRFVVDLAAEREAQFTVMDKEAQRCRELIVSQPAPTKGSGRKR